MIGPEVLIFPVGMFIILFCGFVVYHRKDIRSTLRHWVGMSSGTEVDHKWDKPFL